MSRPVKKTCGLTLHQALGHKSDHLAQQLGLGSLLHDVRKFIMSLVLSVPGCCQQPDSTGISPLTTSVRTFTTLIDSTAASAPADRTKNSKWHPVFRVKHASTQRLATNWCFHETSSHLRLSHSTTEISRSEIAERLTM